MAATRHRTRGDAKLAHPERLPAISGVAETFTPPPEPVATDGCVHRLKHVTIGRKKQRRLEIVFYNGSVTEVDARACLLGTFTGMTPSGAAGALDAVTEGAIAELIGLNISGSHTGEIFILPMARREIRAEVGVFAGMRQFDEFKPVASPPPGGRGTLANIHSRHVPALEIAAENAARMLARTFNRKPTLPVRCVPQDAPFLPAHSRAFSRPIPNPRSSLFTAKPLRRPRRAVKHGPLHRKRVDTEVAKRGGL